MSSGWLAVIPARQGSKSIPKKNIRNFLGRPLMAWTIDAAIQSGVFERVVLSTDSAEIADIGKSLGVEAPFLRPSALAQDETPTAPVLRHTLDWLRENDAWSPAWVMILEPTSPARQAFHIRDAVKEATARLPDSVASVSEVSHHYVPSKLLTISSEGTMTGIDGTPIGSMHHRRQDLPQYYAFNGLIFACRTDLLLRNPPTIWGDRVFAQRMDNEYNIDLDSDNDWSTGECRMRQLLGKENDE